MSQIAVVVFVRKFNLTFANISLIYIRSFVLGVKGVKVMSNNVIFKIRSFVGRGIVRLWAVTVCRLIFWQTVTFRRRFLPPFSGKLQVLAEGLLVN